MKHISKGDRFLNVAIATSLLCCGLRAQADQRQIAAYRSIRNVKIVAAQSHPGPEFPFLQKAESCFRALGYNVATTEGETYDAIYSINATGEAVSAVYEVRGQMFTGALGSVTIRFEVPGYRPLIWQFTSKIDPPNLLTFWKNRPSEPSSPSNAPFHGVFSSLEWSIPYTLGEVYGVEALITICRKSLWTSFTSESLQVALEELGRNAIPPLIEILRLDKDLRLREFAAQALGEITSEKYGSDDAGLKEWEEWWRVHQQTSRLDETNVNDISVPRLSMKLVNMRAHNNCLEVAGVSIGRSGGAGTTFWVKPHGRVTASLEIRARKEYYIQFRPNGNCMPNSWTFSIGYSRRDGTVVEERYRATYNSKPRPTVRLIEK